MRKEGTFISASGVRSVWVRNGLGNRKQRLMALEKKMAWENFYNYHRPHGGLKGKTLYEVLKAKLSV